MIKAKMMTEPPKNIIRSRMPNGLLNTGGSILGCLKGKIGFKRS